MREDLDSPLWVAGKLNPMVREIVHYDGTRDQFRLRYDYCVDGVMRCTASGNVNVEDLRAWRRELLTALERDLKSRGIAPEQLEPLSMPAGYVPFDWSMT